VEALAVAMIFPGMDPYLEDPRGWTGVHNSFIVYLRDQLQPQLRPRYIAAIEDRVFVEGPDREIIPDDWLRRARPRPDGRSVAVMEADEPVWVRGSGLEIHESYVTILDRQSGQEVVTVIEVLSPSNKFAGPGRESYRSKQAEVLASRAHLVEIDLLRAGPHVLAVPELKTQDLGRYDNLVCVNRAEELRGGFELYPRRLRDRLPRVRIPLAGDDPDVVLDVQAVLAQTYEAGSYADRLDYSKACVPPLSPEDQAWADGLIQAAMRPGA